MLSVTENRRPKTDNQQKQPRDSGRVSGLVVCMEQTSNGLRPPLGRQGKEQAEVEKQRMHGVCFGQPAQTTIIRTGSPVNSAIFHRVVS
jgi:hypothetical protein